MRMPRDNFSEVEAALLSSHELPIKNARPVDGSEIQSRLISIDFYRLLFLMESRENRERATQSFVNSFVKLDVNVKHIVVPASVLHKKRP